MKERPILFSGPMVRAILEGRKTQTRRVVKPQSDTEIHGEPYWNVGGFRFRPHAQPQVSGNPIKCQFGQPGDRLWVRETFQEFFDDEIPDGRTRAVRGHMGVPAQPNRISYVAFRADGEIPASAEHGEALWRPSIFMRRWASRITLEVTAVRVERLQDISDDDAELEGITRERGIVGCHCNGGVHTEVMGDLYFSDMGGDGFEFASSAYRQLWESINGPGSWAANPWVWVIEFKRVTP